MTHLQPDGMFVLALHIIDVPGHPRHGVDGFFHHLIALFLGVKVLGDLLQWARGVSGRSLSTSGCGFSLRGGRKAHAWT